MHLDAFLSAFAKLGKATLSSFMFFSLSVRKEQFASPPARQIFINCDILTILFSKCHVCQSVRPHVTIRRRRFLPPTRQIFIKSDIFIILFSKTCPEIFKFH